MTCCTVVGEAAAVPHGCIPAASATVARANASRHTRSTPRSGAIRAAAHSAAGSDRSAVTLKPARLAWRLTRSYLVGNRNVNHLVKPGPVVLATRIDVTRPECDACTLTIRESEERH